MAGKKNKNKQKQQANQADQKRNNSISFELSKTMLGGLFSLVVSIVGLYEAINYFRNDPQTFYFIIFPALAGVASLGLLIQAFRKKNPIAFVWLAVGMLVITVSLIGWQSYIESVKNKLVVVIATFDGPEESFGVRNQILENLTSEFGDSANIKIVPVDNKLIPGNDKARKLGEKYQADIVIWGWYSPTTDPNIYIHIENLSPEQLYILNENTTLHPVTTLKNLQSSAFQQQAGRETSALISFLAGIIEYQSKNYDTALERFDQAIENLQGEAQIIENKSDIYFYRANSNFALDKYEQAIRDYGKTIEINPNSYDAYHNRGTAYFTLGQDQQALTEYNQAIILDPQDAGAYYSRGTVYIDLGKYDLALADLDKALEIDPQFALTYNNRGNIFSASLQYDKAIDEYDKAIALEPKLAVAYDSRGFCYYRLNQYKRAIVDYTKAVEIDPQYALAYNDLGVTYVSLGEYKQAVYNYTKAINIEPQRAIAYVNRGYAYLKLEKFDLANLDFTQAINIYPQYADAYNYRGLSYQKLGKTAEAEADFKKYEELTGEKP
jgi:tetratricopeptide (TPR) repeat protein